MSFTSIAAAVAAHLQGEGGSRGLTIDGVHSPVSTELVGRVKALMKLRDDIERKKTEHDRGKAEKNAEKAEEDAVFAVQYAYAAVEEAEYAVLDAALARMEAKEKVGAGPTA